MADHRSFFLDEALYRYVLDHTSPADEVQHALAEATTALGPLARMQVARDQAAFLSMLTAALRPHLAVEVGTFTGTSSLAIARALPDGGRLLCCDVSEEWTDVARHHWEAAGVADRIDLVIAPAIETLRGLPANTVVDLAFIDADKTGYLGYYEELVPRLAPHGLIVVDNVLWSGRVLDPAVGDVRHGRPAGVQRPSGVRRTGRRGGPVDRGWGVPHPTPVNAGPADSGGSAGTVRG